MTEPQRRRDHCPRDAFGFCWIAQWDAGRCGGASEGKVRCPADPREAARRLEAARQHRIAQIRRDHPSRLLAKESTP